MPGDLTDADLDAMEARADAATAGPWESSIEGRDHESGDSFISTGELAEVGPDMYVSLEGVPAPAEDLDFIAASRQDVPRLVAEIRRLRQQG